MDPEVAFTASTYGGTYDDDLDVIQEVDSRDAGSYRTTTSSGIHCHVTKLQVPSSFFYECNEHDDNKDYDA